MTGAGAEMVTPDLAGLVVRTPFQGNLKDRAVMFVEGELIPVEGNVEGLLRAQYVYRATVQQVADAKTCGTVNDGKRCGRKFVGEEYLRSHKLRQHRAPSEEPEDSNPQLMAMEPEPGPSDLDGSRKEALQARGLVQHSPGE